MGIPYALAVEASIVMAAFFTKGKYNATTRRIAWFGYFSFVVSSGIMNVGWIKPETFPAWTYALFPPLAISILGFLYRQVSGLGSRKLAGKQTEGQKSLPETPEEQPEIVPATEEIQSEMPEVVPETNGKLPEWLPVLPDSLPHFRQLVDDGELILPPGLKGKDLAEFVPVLNSERNGRLWLEAVGYRTVANSKENQV